MFKIYRLLLIMFKIHRSKEDFDNLNRIMKDLEQMRVSAKDNDDAVRKWIEEFRRRLIRAGLSK